MQFSDYRNIAFGRSGRILTITLNRPDKLNATDAALHEELARVFTDAARDPDSDVLVLTGAGRAFCAGGDIGWIQDMIADPAVFEKTGREAKQIIFSMLDCEKPIIAKLNGHATGLGCTMALFCDVIFAADNAKLGDPHVSVGFVAGDGGAVIWPQLVGYAIAKELLMTGDLVTAQRAAEIGLINYALPLEELDTSVDAFAVRLTSGAIRAISWTKTCVNIGLKQLAHSIMDASIAYEAMSNKTEDHKEAVEAFLERRKPVFVGR
jgi:enoyl-CoA hydratase